MTTSRRARIRRMNLPNAPCGHPGPRAPGCVETIGDVERCALPSRIGGRIAAAGSVQMVRVNAGEIHRLAEEVERMVSSFGDPPAWVHDKLSAARGDLDDVARYLRGSR